MIKNPKVSIVISTYNRPAGLARALASAAAQTYQNIEIIVVDDGGFEATKNVIDEFKRNHPGAILKRVITNDVGLAGSRNAGAKNASGDFIAFVDDDDFFFPNCISEMLKAFEQCGEEYKAAVSDWIIEDENGRMSYGVSVQSPLKCPGNGWMFKRGVFYEKNLWCDDFFRYSEDFELGLRSWGTYKTIYLHIPLFKYAGPLPVFSAKDIKQGSNNVVNNYAYLVKAIQKNDKVVQGMSRDDRAVIEHHAGLFAAREGLMPEARMHLSRSLRLRFSFARLFYFFATFLGQRGFMVARAIVSRLMRRVVVWRSRKLVEKYRSEIPVT